MAHRRHTPNRSTRRSTAWKSRPFAATVHEVPRRTVAAIAVTATAATCVIAAPAHATGETYRIRIVNTTGVAPSNVYVSLIGQTLNPALPGSMAMNTAYPLVASNGPASPWVSEGGNRYSVTLTGTWTSGGILYSLNQNGDPDFDGYDAQPTVGLNEHPYDLSELTFDSNSTFNGDISAVNQIGIPSRLTIIDPDGTTVSTLNGTSDDATEYVGCPAATSRIMKTSLTGWDPQTAGVWRTQGNGDFLQLEGLGSAAIYPNYPSFEGYVKEMAGKTLTVRGYFAGGQVAGLPAYYNYSGTVDDDGNVFLTGGLYDNSDSTGASHYPAPSGIYIAATEMYGHDSTTWAAGSGYGVYAQNGPYIVGPANGATLTGGHWSGAGTVPPVSAGSYINSASQGWQPGASGAYNAIGNDVYGWIYGDLVVSFAMGYWGSTAATGSPIYNSYRWNTNRPVDAAAPASGDPWWTPAGLPAYEDAWTGPAPDYARFNLYQGATQKTGTSYGMALGDRFAPAGTRSPELGVTNTPIGSDYGTWQIELLPNTGCATASSMTPSTGSVTGGSVVTITGKNLYPGLGVMFGSVPATSVSVSTEPISGVSTVLATAPAHAGNGAVAVSVTNAYGTASPAIDSAVAGTFTYTGASSPPAPPAPPSQGAGAGSGVDAIPAGSVKVQVVKQKLRSDSRPVKVTIPLNAATALAVRGLPRKQSKAAVAIKINGKWTSLGSAKVSRKGKATLPAFTLATSERQLVRVKSGGRIFRLAVTGTN